MANPWEIEDPDDDQGQNTSAFKQLRQYAERLEKDLKKRDTTIEELSQFKQEAVSSQRQQVAAVHLKELGLSEQSAKLFVLANSDADPTKEAVAKFALDHGLISAAAQTTTTEETQQPGVEQPSTQAFLPMTAGGGSPVNRITHDQFRELMKTDQQAAYRAVAEGRVDGLQSSI